METKKTKKKEVDKATKEKMRMRTKSNLSPQSMPKMLDGATTTNSRRGEDKMMELKFKAYIFLLLMGFIIISYFMIIKHYFKDTFLFILFWSMGVIFFVALSRILLKRL